MDIYLQMIKLALTGFNNYVVQTEGLLLLLELQIVFFHRYGYFMWDELLQNVNKVKLCTESLPINTNQLMVLSWWREWLLFLGLLEKEMIIIIVIIWCMAQNCNSLSHNLRNTRHLLMYALDDAISYM